MALVTEREKGAHLLRRFGLGASEAELDYYLKDGYSGAIDLLLSYEDIDEGFGIDPNSLRGKDQRFVNMPGAVAWWGLRLILTRRPLQERMTLFWHDHFATSASKVTGSALMLAQNELLRSHATGNFRTMLHEVSKDPAMLFWLDNQQNVRGKPNENFAREVMELFTLGIGNYTEKDVQEAARAFTGWAYLGPTAARGRQARFLFRPALHDFDEKLVLGKRGPLSGEDVLDHLCNQYRTAEYLTTKIWDWFVWPNPDAATIAPFARRFQQSGLDIKSLLKDIMRSTEFVSVKAERKIVKNPVDAVIVTMRQLGVGEQTRSLIETLRTEEDYIPRASLAAPAAAVNSMKSMGMWLFYPPDVAGWDIGQSWITSATMLERINWGGKLFGEGKGGRVPMRYPAYSFFESDPTPRGIVRKLLSIFDAPLSGPRIAILEAAAAKEMGSGLTARNAGKVAATVTRLMFAAPEFQTA